MENSTAAAMPARDAARFRRAVSDFRGPDVPLPLAAVILGAHSSGWSYRTIARSLELSRERTMQLASLRAEPYDVPRYEPGADFPTSVIREFRRRSETASARREKVKAKAAATVKAARDAGWSYAVLSTLVGLSDEWIRRIAAEASPAIEVPPFTAPPRAKAAEPVTAAPGRLEEDEAAKMAELAAAARTSSKNTGRSLGQNPSAEELAAVERTAKARRASEELSDMIIAAKRRNVPWADLDAACGYRPGAARARAVRHGYGSLPPTRTAYQRAATPVDTSA